MKNCDNCIYRGELETGYIGMRCTNKDCLYYKSPTIAIVNAGLDNCKGYKEKKDD